MTNYIPFIASQNFFSRFRKHNRNRVDRLRVIRNLLKNLAHFLHNF